MVLRALDLTLATIALLVLSPIMAVVAFAIVATSEGPAIYRQVRVGRYGKRFHILKFRTMVKHADQLGSSVTTGRDLRTTPIGRTLRRSKVDELPQLLNVLAGDMSIVGPRPDVPEIVATYTADMLRVLEVRPGMTSVASLDLSNEEALLSVAQQPERFYVDVVVPAKVAKAMRHVEDRSVRFYFAVILMTAAKLLGGMFGDPTPGPLTKQLMDVAVADSVDAGDGRA